MDIGNGIRHTSIQVFPDAPAPLLQGVIAALSGRALAVLDRGEPQNNAFTTLPAASAAHRHVFSWLAYAELHVAETLQWP